MGSVFISGSARLALRGLLSPASAYPSCGAIMSQQVAQRRTQVVICQTNCHAQQHVPAWVYDHVSLVLI